MSTAAACSREPAELERRLAAFVVDRLLAWAVAGAAYLAVRHLLAPARPVAVAAVAVAALLVVGASLALLLGFTGSSPGRAAAGLRVVDARTGDPIGVRRAAGRQLLLGLATLPTLGLGAAVLAWTTATAAGGRRRGWHDRVVGSVVVDARSPRATEVEPEEPAPRPLVNLTALRLVPASPGAPGSPGAVRPRATARRAEAASAGSAARPGPARWRIVLDSGQSLVVDGPVLLGRDPEPRRGEVTHSLVRLGSADLSVSKTHAQLRLTSRGSLVVIDRGSTNGSTLLRAGASRELPAEHATTLLDGDRVRLGDRELSVVREPVGAVHDPITVR